MSPRVGRYEKLIEMSVKGRSSGETAGAMDSNTVVRTALYTVCTLTM